MAAPCFITSKVIAVDGDRAAMVTWRVDLPADFDTTFRGYYFTETHPLFRPDSVEAARADTLFNPQQHGAEWRIWVKPEGDTRTCEVSYRIDRITSTELLNSYFYREELDYRGSGNDPEEEVRTVTYRFVPMQWRALYRSRSVVHDCPKEQVPSRSVRDTLSFTFRLRQGAPPHHLTLVLRDELRKPITLGAFLANAGIGAVVGAALQHYFAGG